MATYANADRRAGQLLESTRFLSFSRSSQVSSLFLLLEAAKEQRKKGEKIYESKLKLFISTVSHQSRHHRACMQWAYMSLMKCLLETLSLSRSIAFVVENVKQLIQQPRWTIEWERQQWNLPQLNPRLSALWLESLSEWETVEREKKIAIDGQLSAFFCMQIIAHENHLLEHDYYCRVKNNFLSKCEQTKSLINVTDSLKFIQIQKKLLP